MSKVINTKLLLESIFSLAIWDSHDARMTNQDIKNRAQLPSSVPNRSERAQIHV